jgi:flagellar biosynthesis/type III secretory pathway chaperone
VVAEALSELEALLADERDAIRRLDGQAVLEFAQRKQALMGKLAGQREALCPADATRLRGLTPALRQNGVLLAHARDVLRDAIAVLRRETAPPTYATTRNVVPLRRSVLSVRG